MPRTRLTVFSRFILFLLIALPIVYVAAALFNNEDPVANVKGWLGLDDRAEPHGEHYEIPPPAAGEQPLEMRELQLENERLRLELERCRSEQPS